ncbi:MAG: MBL fold metallo-hydrolase [Myxococcales bacterium]|nr:MBL fold metallo-hydrolase [Myxococcales bacterium]
MTAISFLGATDTVTGSRYLVETPHARVLIDCGLFQGYRKLRERNWRSPPLAVRSLDAVVLTHAHIDHSGYLPRLCNEGYRGPVHCTRGTADLLEVLLPDAGFLQEEDARRANRYGYSRHAHAEPLYTREDAERSLHQVQRHGFYQWVDVAPGVRVRFTRAGHILGSACVALETEGQVLVFTGDVGRPNDPIMKAPDPLPHGEYLVTESTYGNRLHPDKALEDALADAIGQTAKRGGTVVVPAFAVGRAQHLLHLVAQLKSAERIPDLPVFLDSPMAIEASQIFCRNTEDHGLTEVQCHSMCHVASYARTPEQSKAIDASLEPKVVISASGMATGGRVLHHLRRFLPDEQNTILFVGYQATGTRGRTLLEGTEALKLHGEYVRVRARIVQLPGLSAHADYSELLSWMAASNASPRRVFVTHGEPAASDALRRRLRERFDWDAIVPEDGARYSLPGQERASTQHAESP